MTAAAPTMLRKPPTTPRPTTTRSRQVDRATGGGGVAGGVVAADAGSRADPTARARPGTLTARVTKGPVPTPLNPRMSTAKTPTTPTTPAPTTRTVRRSLATAGAAAAAASRVLATTTTRLWHLTIRPTPWCMSGRHAPRASLVLTSTGLLAQPTPRSRASTARLGWRPSGNGAETDATPGGAARRSCTK